MLAYAEFEGQEFLFDPKGFEDVPIDEVMHKSGSEWLEELNISNVGGLGKQVGVTIGWFSFFICLSWIGFALAESVSAWCRSKFTMCAAFWVLPRTSSEVCLVD